MMKTDDLITLLATHAGTGRTIWPDVLFAALGPLVVTCGILLMMLGIRPDLTAAITLPLVVWKWLLPGVLVAAGIPLGLALSRPESHAYHAWRVACMAVAAFGAVLLATRAAVLPPTDWIAAIKGQTFLACLALTTGISLAGVTGGLAVLRRGAATRLGLSSLAIGLVSGGASAFLYALHCNHDDPVFYIKAIAPTRVTAPPIAAANV